MKHLAVLLSLVFAGLIVSIGSVQNSYALTLGMSSEKILETQELVILGHVDSAETKADKTEYTVNVSEYVKAPDGFEKKDTIKAVGCAKGQRGGCTTFDTGQDVLFALNERNGVLQVSEVSFVAPNPNCTVNDFFALHDAKYGLKISQNDQAKQFFTGKPIDITFYAYNRQLDSSPYRVTVEFFRASNQTMFSKTFEGQFEECVPNIKLETSFTPEDMGKYGWRYTASYEGGESVWGFPIVHPGAAPLKQYRAGVQFNEIQCNENMVPIQKYDNSPACVKPVTKQYLMDRGWAETISFDQIRDDHDLIRQNIIRMDDGRISLYPENTCASINVILLAEQDIQRYKNDKQGLNETNVLQITDSDFDQIPVIGEIILAADLLDAPFNEHSSAYMDGLTFVDYEFFLMDKAIQKYGGSQDDYFIKLDEDYKERFSDPKKQGFSNTFEAPLITYGNKTYSIGGTVFWTSDEHEPMRMTVSPVDEIKKDDKFIVLADEDMKSIPKIKQAIEEIGTMQESISGRKGLPEGQWNDYIEWFKQKSQDRLGAGSFRLIEYDGRLYFVGFAIC